MTPRKVIGESPFSIIYSTEVVIPSKFTQEENDDLRKEDLLLVEEKMESALI